MNQYRLKGCRRCGGDLARDEGDWICLQCGAYSYVGLYNDSGAAPATLPEWPAGFALPDVPSDPGQSKGAGYRHWNRGVAFPGFACSQTARAALALHCSTGLP